MKGVCTGVAVAWEVRGQRELREGTTVMQADGRRRLCHAAEETAGGGWREGDSRR